MATATQPKQQPTGNVYSHTPRPPENGGQGYQNQLRYGGLNCVEVNHNRETVSELEVFRDSDRMSKTAQLALETYHAGSGLRWSLQTELTADQLEALAFALLDAAADIRSLKGGAA